MGLRINDTRPSVERTLGLALIVKDEELRLEGCLRSLEGIDEMIVVDTGSTDRTGEIARACGATFIENEYQWKNDFADARNFSLSKCTTDWVLWLGAGERVDPGGIRDMKEVISRVRDDVQCIDVLMHNGDMMFLAPRLIRRTPEVKFVYAIHEHPTFRKKERHEEITIRFGTFTPNKYPGRNLEIIQQELLKNPDDLRMQYCAGREFFILGHTQISIYWFERYIRTREKLGVAGFAEYADVLFNLAWAYIKERDLDKAKENLMRCLGVNADFREAAQLMATISESEGNILNRDRWLMFAETARNRGLNFKTKGNF